MNLYLDIETIPANEEITEQDLRNKLPKSVTKQETIQKKLHDDRDALTAAIIKERSINKYQCRIICIAYSFGDGEVQKIIGNEKNIILTLQNAVINHLKENGGSVTGIYVVGHNIKKFDAPILFLRAAKYRAKELLEMLIYTRRQIEDTMEMGVYWLYNEYVSLKDLCRFFGRETKEDLDGSKVYEYYKEGKIEDIANYCCKDVEDVKFVYKKLRL